MGDNHFQQDMMMAGGRPPCPCISLVHRERLKQAIVESEKKNFFQCQECLEEAASETKKGSGGKGGRQAKKEAQKEKSAKGNRSGGKGGGGGWGGAPGKHGKHGKNGNKADYEEELAIAFPSQFICMTCLYSGCDTHAPNHYFNTNRKKGGKRHGQRAEHAVMLNFNESDASLRLFSFFCHHCNLQCGSGMSSCEGVPARNIDGIDIDEQGYVMDYDGELAQGAEKIGEMVSNALGGLFPHTSEGGKKKKRRGRDEDDDEEDNKRKGRRKKGSSGESQEEKGKRVEYLTRAGVMGLFNMGNTCFYNSTIQCIFQCVSLMRGLKDADPRSMPGPLSAALLATTMKYGDYSTGSVYVPKTLFAAVCHRNCMFAEYGQQDAQELFSCIMNGISDEYKYKKRAVAECPVDTSIGGEMQQTIVCHECMATSRLKTKFYDISIPLNRELTVGIKDFFDPVLLTGDTAFVCEKCCAAAYEEQKRLERQDEERKAARAAEEAAQQQIDFEALLQLDVQMDDADDGVSDNDNDQDDDQDEEEEETRSKVGDGASTAGNSTPPPTPSKPATPPPASTVVLEPTAPATAGGGSTKASSAKPKTVKVDATMTMTINKLNPVMVVHVKRFSFNMRLMNWEKNNMGVSVPPELDLSKFFTPGCSPLEDSDSAAAAAGGKFTPPPAAKPKKQKAPPVDLGGLPFLYPKIPKKALIALLEINGGDHGLTSMMLEEGVHGLEGLIPEGGDNGEDEDEGADQDDEGSQNQGNTAPSKYILTGVVEHVGTVNGGHYISYVRSGKVDQSSGKRTSAVGGDWFLCNDSHCTRASQEEALNAQPYLLFYELR